MFTTLVHPLWLLCCLSVNISTFISYYPHLDHHVSDTLEFSLFIDPPSLFLFEGLSVASSSNLSHGRLPSNIYIWGHVSVPWNLYHLYSPMPSLYTSMCHIPLFDVHFPCHRINLFYLFFYLFPCVFLSSPLERSMKLKALSLAPPVVTPAHWGVPGT